MGLPAGEVSGGADRIDATATLATLDDLDGLDVDAPDVDGSAAAPLVQVPLTVSPGPAPARSAAAAVPGQAGRARTDSVSSVGEELSPAARELLSPQARALRAASRSPATLAAYASDWAHFTRWCTTHDQRPLPATAATVANYLADCAPHWREATDTELALATAHGDAANGDVGRRERDRVHGRHYRDGAKPATLRRRLVAIRHRHHAEDHPDPTAHRDVREVLAGITRLEAAAGRKVAAAATRAPLLAMLATTEHDPSLEADATLDATRDAGLPTGRVHDLRADPRDARDAAILTVGMVGALRRSELAALRVGDIRFVPAGVELTLHRSKTDQAGHGHVLALPTLDDPTCPVAALRRWLRQWLPTARPDTPLFRRIHRDQGGDPARRISEHGLSPRSIADVVTHRAATAPELPGPGPDGRHAPPAPDQPARGLEGQWSGHSLRRGFATAAYAGGADEVEIMRHGRWRSASTMRGYLEEGTRFRDTHPAHHLIPDSSRLGPAARGTHAT